MEEDVAGTERLLGHAQEVCELCGRVVPAGGLQREDVDRGGGAEPVEAIRVCPVCKQALDQDAAPVDATLTPETGEPDI
jgi:hypothetical protein